MSRRTSAVLIALVALLAIAATDPAALLTQLRAEQRAHVHKAAYAASEEIPTTTTVDQPCVDGMAAGEFACDGIDLLAFIPAADFGGVLTSDPSGLVYAGISDVWGWTDDDGTEYAMVGHTNGTAMFRVNDGIDAAYLGSVVNTAPGQAIWHDIKVIDHYAVIVSESGPFHGMQVYDLHNLRDLSAADPGTPLVADTTFLGSSSQHNVVTNDDTDFAYIVGSGFKVRTPVGGLTVQRECASGLFMIDMADPLNPVDAGCYEGDEYIHDAQCVVYDGPDGRYAGREICAAFSEDYMSFIDVEDKANPTLIGRLDYSDIGVAYTHQGWFTEDFRFVLMNDELDESDQVTDAEGENPVTHTRTIVVDASDLENPTIHHLAMRDGSDGNPATASIDHNNYVRDGLAYQSNYTSGLRVIDLDGLYATDADGEPAPEWEEIAYFDTFPSDDDTKFAGTWSNYPYFESGIIPVTGIGEGLFFLRMHDR